MQMTKEVRGLSDASGLSWVSYIRSEACARSVCIADHMRSNADCFEELAVAVQAESEDDDRAISHMSLDSYLPLWNGKALIDLAKESQSRSFLETCCPEVSML